jgi:hypothetical protein
MTDNARLAATLAAENTAAMTSPTAPSPHVVTAEWSPHSSWPSYRLTCNAPADAICHAVYACDCPEWDEAGVDEHGPWHTHYDADADDDVRHYGKTDPAECHLRDWLENSDEAILGSVTFPVRPEWEGDGYVFHTVEVSR